MPLPTTYLDARPPPARAAPSSARACRPRAWPASRASSSVTRWPSGWSAGAPRPSPPTPPALSRPASTPNGVFGAKLLYRQLLHLESLARQDPELADLPLADILTRLFPNLHLIWNTREDKVRQAISWFKARQTGVWGQDQGTEAVKLGAAWRRRRRPPPTRRAGFRLRRHRRAGAAGGRRRRRHRRFLRRVAASSPSRSSTKPSPRATRRPSSASTTDFPTPPILSFTTTSPSPATRSTRWWSTWCWRRPSPSSSSSSLS